MLTSHQIACLMVSQTQIYTAGDWVWEGYGYKKAQRDIVGACDLGQAIGVKSLEGWYGHRS